MTHSHHRVRSSARRGSARYTDDSLVILIVGFVPPSHLATRVSTVSKQLSASARLAFQVRPEAIHPAFAPLICIRHQPVSQRSLCRFPHSDLQNLNINTPAAIASAIFAVIHSCPIARRNSFQVDRSWAPIAQL